MHGLEPVADILGEVENGLRAGIRAAEAAGVARDALVLDPGIGFGKSHEQNLILLAQFKNLSVRLPHFPWLVGTSRKSFIGKILGGAAPTDRLFGTMASVTAAVLGGAHIVRVHDVAATVETVRVADAVKEHL
jgi:dihydropteroate synthase